MGRLDVLTLLCVLTTALTMSQDVLSAPKPDAGQLGYRMSTDSDAQQVTDQIKISPRVIHQVGFDELENRHYQTGDGALVQESGYLRNTNDGLGKVVAKTGSYAYISPEGKPVSISYVANEYGYRPVGDVIPVAPHATPPTF